MKKILPACLLVLMLLVSGCGMSEEKKQAAYRKSPESVMWEKTAEDSENWESSASRQAKAEKTKEENSQKSASTETSTSTESSTSAETSAYSDDDTSDSWTSSSGSSSSTFTNKYGTRTTKCAHSGCNNYIASSGDTNCCTVHSNRCLNCNKYIDEDAMYCMDCLTEAAGGSSYSSYGDSSYSSYGDNSYSSYGDSSYGSSSFDYDDPDPGESFSDYVKRVDPDLYSDMLDIYNSATGGY